MIPFGNQDGYEAIIKTGYRNEPNWTKQPMMDFAMEVFGDYVITPDNFKTVFPPKHRYSDTVEED